MTTSENGIALIKKFESFKSKAYLCPAGVPTIGYGTTENVKLGDTITIEEAVNRLKQHIKPIELYLSSYKLNQNQFDALVSFTYNVGLGALKTSTLMRVIKANSNDFKNIEIQFKRWNKANGKVLSGLTNRRVAEFELYSKKV